MSDDSPVTILEKLSIDTRARDLRHRRGRCSIDTIGARGLGAGSDPGDALLDLHLTLDASDIPAAKRAAYAVTRECAQRNGWNLVHHRLRNIAHAALKHYLRPACSACHGRGMLGVTRDLADKPERPRPCPKCHGTGEQPLPLQNGREIREVVSRMEAARRRAGQRVRKALGLRADVE